MNKCFVIVNPVAGKGENRNIEAYLDHIKALRQYQKEIIYWHTDEQLDTSFEHIRQEKEALILAAGGDGTVNKVLELMDHRHQSISIIPLGSGNGLARHLGIYARYKQGQLLSNADNMLSCDMAYIAGNAFVNVAGLGFDAHISWLFNQNPSKRGLWHYVRHTVRTFLNYAEQTYLIEIDGERHQVKAFLIAFANGTQWGNNFYIAQNASVNDGYLNLVIMHKPKLWQIPILLWQMTRKSTLPELPLFERYQSKHIRILGEETIIAHADGEALRLQLPLDIGISAQCKVQL